MEHIVNLMPPMYTTEKCTYPWAHTCNMQHATCMHMHMLKETAIKEAWYDDLVTVRNKCAQPTSNATRRTKRLSLS